MILPPADNHVFCVPGCRGHPCRGLQSPFGQRAANELQLLPLVPTHRAPTHTCTTVCPATSPTARPCIPGCQRPLGQVATDGEACLAGLVAGSTKAHSDLDD